MAIVCATGYAQTTDIDNGISATDDIYIQTQANESGLQLDKSPLDANENTLRADESAIEDMLSPEATDSLHLPILGRYGLPRICSYPGNMWGLYDWDLHKGMNISLGASVFASFGKHSSGVGFGQNLSAMYATQLTDRVSLAVGGYINNVYWAQNAYREAGLTAVLGYKFDEHWEGYIYGKKSLANTYMPMPLYDMSDIGDRIGAAVRYNINQNVSIQVSVSAGESEHPRRHEHDFRP